MTQSILGYLLLIVQQIVRGVEEHIQDLLVLLFYRSLSIHSGVLKLPSIQFFQLVGLQHWRCVIINFALLVHRRVLGHRVNLHSKSVTLML